MLRNSSSGFTLVFIIPSGIIPTVNTYLPLLQSSQGESFLGRKWLIGKKIKKELDKPEGISHTKMV